MTYCTAKIWLSTNMLQLNEDKTHQILCTLKRYAPKDVEAVKLLRFWLEPKLSWDIHVSRIYTKPSRVIFLLQKLRLVISEKYLVTLYYSLFHSHYHTEYLSGFTKQHARVWYCCRRKAFASVGTVELSSSA